MPLIGTSTTLGYSKDSRRIPLSLSTDFTGTTNAFLAKYTATGTLLWTARIAGSGTVATNQIYSTATDSTGAIYGVGQVSLTRGGGSSSLVFYNADGSYASTMTLNTPTAAIPRAAFLVKYSATGVFQWGGYVITGYTVTGVQYGYGIAIDPSDGIYMSGIVGANGNPVYAYNGNGTVFGTSYTSGNGAVGDAFLVKYNTTGSVQWLTRVGAPNTDEYGLGLAADASGVYMAGQAGSGTVTAYNAAGTSGGTLTTTSVDGFLVKYTLAGVVSWITRIASTAADIAWGVALDSTGSVYICGQYGAATMTAYSASGSAFATTLASIGLGDSFIVKYNASGTVQWVARQGGTAADIGYRIATDSGNNVYLAGSQGAATFTAYSSSGTAFGTTLTSRGAGDAFLLKYDSGGTVQWVAQVAGVAADIGYGLVTDLANNIYVAVSTSSTSLVVYNSDASTFTTLSLTTTPASAIVQYNSSGTVQRATALNSSTTPYAICRDAAPALILGGTTSAYVTRNLGPSSTVALTLRSTIADGYVAKYTPNGQPLWVSCISGTGSTPRGIATDSRGNIYATGDNNGNNASIYNANGTRYAVLASNRGYLIKYTPAGAVTWMSSWGGGTIVGGSGLSVVLDSCGYVYVAATIGASLGTVANPTYAIYDGSGALALTALGGSFSNGDAIVLKYSLDGSAQWFARFISTSGTSYARAGGIATSPDNAVIAVGRPIATAFDVRNASGTVFLSRSTLMDTVTVKYNAVGVVQWAALTGTTPVGGNGNYAQSIACDASGSVYVGSGGGSTSNSNVIYNADGTTFQNIGTTYGTQNSNDAYLIKYDICGRGQWVSRIQSSNGDAITRVAVDQANNALYVGGWSGGASSFSTAPIRFPWTSDGQTYIPDVAKQGSVGFLAKYAPLTDVYPKSRWAFQLDSSSDAATDVVSDVTIDRRGNVYVACTVNDISAGKGILSDLVVPNYLPTVNPTTNVSLVCYGSNGMLRWYQSIRGAGTYTGANAVGTDYDCNLIIGGKCTGPNTYFYAKA